MYETFAELMNERGITPYKVHKDTGISQSVLSAWKLGQTTPRTETLAALAEYFGVSVDFLMTGRHEEKPSASGRSWHFSDKAAEMAEILTKRPDLMDLLSVAQNLAPEAVRAFSGAMEASLPKKGQRIG